MSLFRRRSQLDPRSSTRGRWNEVTGSHNGRPMITRYRTDIRKSVGHPGFPVQIHLTLPLAEADLDVDGQPTVDERARLDEFEDQVLVPLCHERAVLVLIVTSAGVREYVLYAHSADWVGAFQTEMKARWTAHDVACNVRRDPRWDGYRAFAR